MLDFFKTQKDLSIALIVTILVSTILFVLSIMDNSVINEQSYLIEEQIETLTDILEKENTVNTENLKIAAGSQVLLKDVYKRLSADFSVFEFKKQSMTALAFKSELTNVVTMLDADTIAAGIGNAKKAFSTSVKALNAKRESDYTPKDIELGAKKLLVLKQISEATKSLKLSSLEAITWHVAKEAEEEDEEMDERFISTQKLELDVTGSQASITNLVNTLSLNNQIFFVIQGIEMKNVSKLSKPKPVKSTGTEGVDLDSKESKEVLVDNTLTCKLYIDVVQFKLNQEK